MDHLQINFKELIPYVIEGFTVVCGEEYHDMIEEKLNNLTILDYVDVDGIESYVWYLKDIKSKELSLKFLNYLGYDVKKDIEKKKYYKLRSEINNLLQKYLGRSNAIFDNSVSNRILLKAFENDKHGKNNKTRIQQVTLINNLLRGQGKSITLDELDNFCKTKEFKCLSMEIKKALLIYKDLEEEYQDWTRQFEPIEKYVADERKRKEKIIDSKKDKMVSNVRQQINPEIKNIIGDWKIEEQWDLLFDVTDDENVLIIENFTQENLAILHDQTADITTKSWIVYWQMMYFKKLGIKFPEETLSKGLESENIDAYIKWLEQEKTQKLIPSIYLIKHAMALHKKMKEVIQKEYYTNRADFKKICKIIDMRYYPKDAVYEKMQEQKVCIIKNSKITLEEHDEFSSVMYFTIRPGDAGQLAHVFIHECGHAIDQGILRNSFESHDSIEQNQYNVKYRKYERFNETLNDLLTMEVEEYLREHGIYLIESQELVNDDTFNRNTWQTTKQILCSLLMDFRAPLIKAKVTASPEEFTKLIGEENFEELIDIVNKVDLLTKDGLGVLNEKPELKRMYTEELNKLNELYKKIYAYYEKNFGSGSVSM